MTITMGFEIEFAWGYSASARDMQNRLYIRLPHDNSIVTEVVMRGKPRMARGRTLKLGFEVASPVFEDIYDVDKFLQYVYFLAARIGGKLSDRCAMHVHISLNRRYSVTFLNKVIAFGLKYSYDLLTIGGLGGRNRGFINDFAYQRPFDNPLIVPNKKIRRDGFDASFVYATNYERLLHIKFRDAGHLLGMLGDSGNIGYRYNAARYSTINLLSIPAHNTIEFRVFNVPPTATVATAVVDMSAAIIKFLLEVPSYKYVLGMEKSFYELLDFLPFDIPINRDIMKRLFINSTSVEKHMIRRILFHRYVVGFYDGDYYYTYSYDNLRKLGVLVERGTTIHQPIITDVRRNKIEIDF